MFVKVIHDLNKLKIILYTKKIKSILISLAIICDHGCYSSKWYFNSCIVTSSSNTSHCKGLTGQVVKRKSNIQSFVETSRNPLDETLSNQTRGDDISKLLAQIERRQSKLEEISLFDTYMQQYIDKIYENPGYFVDNPEEISYYVKHMENVLTKNKNNKNIYQCINMVLAFIMLVESSLGMNKQTLGIQESQQSSRIQRYKEYDQGVKKRRKEGRLKSDINLNQKPKVSSRRSKDPTLSDVKSNKSLDNRTKQADRQPVRHQTAGNCLQVNTNIPLEKETSENEILSANDRANFSTNDRDNYSPIQKGCSLTIKPPRSIYR
mgnify:CR=1 FL=1